MKILVADRQIVRPGDCLAVLDKEEALPEKELRYFPDKHIYIFNNKVFSDIIGIASVSEGSLSVIPLEGVYYPRKDDIVIGVISDVGLSYWEVDIKAPYKAILPAS
ncbi:MAG: RNA-binding protein, partial [Desulfurococcaceae archaeon]